MLFQLYTRCSRSGPLHLLFHTFQADREDTLFSLLLFDTLQDHTLCTAVRWSHLSTVLLHMLHKCLPRRPLPFQIFQRDRRCMRYFLLLLVLFPSDTLDKEWQDQTGPMLCRLHIRHSFYFRCWPGACLEDRGSTWLFLFPPDNFQRHKSRNCRQLLSNQLGTCHRWTTKMQEQSF